MGLLTRQSGKPDYDALFQCVDVVASVWNEKLHKLGKRYAFARQYKLLIGEQEVVQCCHEGERILAAFFSAPAGAFKRIATLLIVARNRPFFTISPTPSSQAERQTLLSEAIILLIPVVLSLLVVKSSNHTKSTKWERLKNWQGFSSHLVERHFRSLVEWSGGASNDELGRLVLAVSLIIQETYERGSLSTNSKKARIRIIDKSQALIPRENRILMLERLDSSTESNSALLKNNLSKIPTGTKDAGHYHKEIFKLLHTIFDKSLANGEIEQAVDNGRKRIDIVFENAASEGFFQKLIQYHHIHCPYIFFECKNYKEDIGNPEIDQLSGRFSKTRGCFGIIICRKIIDKSRAVAICKDVVHAGRGFILLLDDEDIGILITARNENNFANINNCLSQKLRAVLM